MRLKAHLSPFRERGTKGDFPHPYLSSPESRNNQPGPHFTNRKDWSLAHRLDSTSYMYSFQTQVTSPNPTDVGNVNLRY